MHVFIVEEGEKRVKTNMCVLSLKEEWTFHACIYCGRRGKKELKQICVCCH